MVRNELAEIVGGIFALIVFVLISGVIIGSLSQIGVGLDLDRLISFVFIISTLLIILAIVTSLVKLFKFFTDFI